MTTIQLYGGNLANTKMRADAPVSPKTVSDSVMMPDGTTLTNLFDELQRIKKELEQVKKETKEKETKKSKSKE